MRKSKIICTIGPASESKQLLEELCLSGMDIARLNFSHGTHAEHLARIKTIKEVRESQHKMVAIMLDTKGPEVRLGTFKNGEATITEGENFTLTTRQIEGDHTICSITYEELPSVAQKGTRILIADGLLSLSVIEIVNETDVLCRVVDGGVLTNRKNVNIPGATSKLPAITQKDIDDLNFGIDNDIDFIAASFIRKAEDILTIRRVLEARNAEHIKIIAKIENQEGVDNCDEILKVADGIMVARGDLGVEIPTEDIPLVQKLLIKKANQLGKPVITATQMLDSMIRNPRPTRAEVTDVANAILDGTDAIMLSGETAAGKYPVTSVMMMASIAEKTETQMDYAKNLKIVDKTRITTTSAISHAACTTALELNANGIITPTQGGSTARMVAKFRPKAPIIAVTPDIHTARTLVMSFGVYPLIIESTKNTDTLFEIAVRKSVEEGYIGNGEVVVITAGVPVGISGSTNLIKVQVVSEILAKGMGLGNGTLIGKARQLNIKEESSQIQEGDILIAEYTDISIMPFIERASALVVEEGGLTSHAAIVGLNLGKPVIVGVKDIFAKIKDGQLITVDANTGVIYNGETRVI